MLLKRVYTYDSVYRRADVCNILNRYFLINLHILQHFLFNNIQQRNYLTYTLILLKHSQTFIYSTSNRSSNANIQTITRLFNGLFSQIHTYSTYN